MVAQYMRNAAGLAMQLARAFGGGTVNWRSTGAGNS
jgi:hypothetical protein